LNAGRLAAAAIIPDGPCLVRLFCLARCSTTRYSLS